MSDLEIMKEGQGEEIINPDILFTERIKVIDSALQELENASYLIDRDGERMKDLTGRLVDVIKEKKVLISEAIKAGENDKAMALTQEIEEIASEIRQISSQVIDLTVRFLNTESNLRHEIGKKN